VGVLGVFIDREDALAAVAELLARDSHRILSISGVSGMGKSYFLAHVRDQRNYRHKRVLVDVENLLAADRLAGSQTDGDELTLRLLRELGAALAQCTPWWRRRRTSNRAHSIGLPMATTGRVKFSQHASDHSQILSTHVTLDRQTPSGRRTQWVEQLRGVAASIRRQRCLLLIDTAEWLHYFEEAHTEQPRLGESTGLGGWFVGEVLRVMLDAAPRLKIVLAGKDAFEIANLPTPHHVLSSWTVEHTAVYLGASGMTDRALAASVHQEARGVPVVTAWLAEACQDHSLDGDAVDSDRLAAIARGRLLSEWLPGHFFAQLTPGQRRLVQAAAVLRTITQGAIEALVPTGLDEGWFDRLRKHSFMQEIPGTSSWPKWRMHPLVREWLLIYLDHGDAERLPQGRIRPELHRLAAEYYEILAGDGVSLEATYHRFACAEDTPAVAWRARMVDAARAGDFERALTHAEVALAPELSQALGGRLPAVLAIAAYIAAYVAYRQGRFHDAERSAEQARTAYQLANNPSGESAALELAGQIAWCRWGWQLASQRWAGALDLRRTMPDRSKELTLLCALSEVTLGRGRLIDADGLLTSALGSLTSVAPPPTPDTQGDSDGLQVDLASGVPSELLEAYLLRLLGEVALCGGQWDRTAKLLGAALGQADQHKNVHLCAEVLCLQGNLAIDQCDVGRADQLLNEAMQAADGCPDKRCDVNILIAKSRLSSAMARLAVPAGRSRAPTPIIQSGALQWISLTRFDETRRHKQQAQQHATAAAQLADEICDLRGRAYAFDGLGTAARLREDFEDAIERFDAALAIFRRVGDQRGEAHTHNGLGKLMFEQGNVGGAQEHHDAALTIFREVGDQRGEAYAHNGLGSAMRQQGNLDDAEEHHRAALSAFRAIGDRRGQGQALDGLGADAWLWGAFDDSREHSLAALAIFRAIGDQEGELNALSTLGSIAADKSDYEGALEYHRAVLTLGREIGYRRGEGIAQFNLGRIERSRRNSNGALEHFGAAADLFRKASDRRGEAYALLERGYIARSQSDLTQALAIFRGIGERRGQAWTIASLGELAWDQGALSRTSEHYTRALAVFREIGERFGEVQMLEGLGRVALRQGDIHHAGERFANSLTISEEIGALSWQAAALSGLGEMALKSGDYGRAIPHLRRAAALYEGCGLLQDAADIRRIIDQQRSAGP
jgi:tetratricopeptide (TPR) repeat protein